MEKLNIKNIFQVTPPQKNLMSLKIKLSCWVKQMSMLKVQMDKSTPAKQTN